jgi:hypothetical protein
VIYRFSLQARKKSAAVIASFEKPQTEVELMAKKQQ